MTEAALTSDFDLLRLSADGRVLVFGGRAADGRRLEIRQPIEDADVMLAMLAVAYQRSLDDAGPRAAQAVEDLSLYPDQEGYALELRFGPVTRVFRLDPYLAAKLAGDLASRARPALRPL